MPIIEVRAEIAWAIRAEARRLGTHEEQVASRAISEYAQSHRREIIAGIVKHPWVLLGPHNWSPLRRLLWPSTSPAGL